MNATGNEPWLWHFFLSVLTNELGVHTSFPWAFCDSFSGVPASHLCLQCMSSEWRSCWVQHLLTLNDAKPRLMSFPNWPCNGIIHPLSAETGTELRINWLKLKLDKLKIIFIGQRKQLKGTSNMTPALSAPCFKAQLCLLGLVESSSHKHFG